MSTIREAKDGSYVTSPDMTAQYLYVFKPDTFMGKDPRYSVTIALPKTDGFWRELAAILTPFVPAKSTQAGLIASNYYPVFDGDTKKNEEYHGKYVLKFSSRFKPKVVYPDCSEVTEETQDIYSGMLCAINFAPYAYEVKGANGIKGIKLTLNGIQKTGEGTPKTGGVRLENCGFSPIEGVANHSRPVEDVVEESGSIW